MTIDAAGVTSKTCFDFYGTGRTSFAIVNPKGTSPNDARFWRTRANGTPSSGANAENIGYSKTSDFITPGYYDSDNKADLAVWRNGAYFIRPSTQYTISNPNPPPTTNIPIVSQQWGISTEIEQATSSNPSEFLVI